MRLKFYKRSAEKFVSRIDPEAFSASGSRVILPVACDELEEITMKIPRFLRRGVSINIKSFNLRKVEYIFTNGGYNHFTITNFWVFC